MKRGSFWRTFETLKTGDTVLLPIPLRHLFRDSPHRAIPHTLLALGAVITDYSSENSKPRGDGKEGAQWTQIATPEPLPDHPQNEDHQQEGKDEEINLKDGQRHSRKDERVLGKKFLNLGKKMIKYINGCGIERDDQGSRDQTDRIEKIHDLPGHQACGYRKKENAVTDPFERSILQTFDLFSLPEEDPIEEIDGRSERAEPPTEEIAKDEDEKEHNEGRKHSQDDLFLRKDRNDPDKRIESKVEVHRDFQFKGKSRSDDKIEKEEKGKGLNRPPQVWDRFFHAAMTFFTRTFERLIWPRPKS